MTTANGRHYLAIPGPSVMPDRVLNAMHRAAPNIYTGALIDMVDGMVPDLRAVARTQHDVALYIGNGHAAWEAALANTLNRGDKILVAVTGRFAEGWAEMARAMGVEATLIDFGNRNTIDLDQIADTLRADTAHGYKAVLAVHVDTSTSVLNDIPALRAAIDSTGHPALLMIDCIASLGCDRFEMDDWGVDVMVTGCQKGLMTPPGMSFVFFNDKAAARREEIEFVSSYWNWKPRTKPELFYQYFCGTAPTHHLYGLREALDMIAEEGLENIWARHDTLAHALWAAFEAWGSNGPLELNIANPDQRSRAVTSVRTGAPHGTAIQDWVKENAGLTLGIGLGMAPPDSPEYHGFFRVGHMGHVNGQMIMGVLGGIESALHALDIPHGAGGLSAAAAIIGQAARQT